MKFRPEIAGLRAVAVMAVVLFHAGFQQLAGGFVGVDIFFVISGFLIISIIARDLSNQSFKFSDFYARRAKRLFPAAFFLVLGTVLLGFFFLQPEAYSDLSQSGIASLGFVANIFFYFNTGYFDQSSEVLPLLHMWSLGVEEQFYIFSPLLLAFAFKLKRKQGLLLLLIFVFVASLLSCLWMVEQNQKFAFFQFPMRSWQFAVGGLIAFLPSLKDRMAGNLLSVTGLAVIVYSILTLSGEVIYPSWNALLPTFACAALIYGTTTEKNFITLFLSTPVFVWIGKISYSTYLWHWPVIVYYRLYILERHFVFVEVLSLTAASLALGYLSWRYVEEKFRHINISSSKAIVGGILGAIVVSLIPFSVIVYNGIPTRASYGAEKLTDLNKMWEFECVETLTFPAAGPSCVLGMPWETAKVKGILWGDSHSEHFAPIFDQVAREKGISIVVAPRSCPPFLNSKEIIHHNVNRAQFTEICTNKQIKTLKWLENNENVKLVFLATAWTGYTTEGRLSQPDSPKAQPELTGELISSSMRNIVEKISKLEKDIILLGDFPRPTVNLNACFASQSKLILRQSECFYELNYLSASKVKKLHTARDILDEIANRYENVKFIDPLNSLCTSEKCATYINGEFIYRDSNHIRRNMKPETNYEIATVLGLNLRLDEVLDKED